MKIEEAWPEWSVMGASIGEGSYGEVYKCVCREDGNEKYSAIKVISVPKSDSDYSNLTPAELENKKAEYKDIVDNFSNEIKILEKLKGNKNIVAIEDSKVVEKEDGIGWQIFIRMELLTDLDKYLKEHTFKKEDILRLGIDLCQALKACSEKKIIHRDIKPSNIFVDSEGNFKLGDFGVAKQLEKTTASITRKGTYEYMSPEVYHSQKCDSRADVYSLAIVLYRLFNNNRLPFLNTEKQMITYSEREDAFNRRIKGEKIPALNEVDENINITLLRALEYKKEDRFKNVEEFETALKRCARGKRAKKSFKQIAENSVITKAVLFILVAAIVSTILAVYLNHHPEPKKEPEAIIVNESTTTETTATTSTTKESTTKETTTEESTTKETTEKTNLNKKTIDKKAIFNAYKKELLSFSEETYTMETNHDQSYIVYDMNNDAIPELIIRDGTCEADYIYYFYTYVDGKAEDISSEKSGHCFMCKPKSGTGIIQCWSLQGNYLITKYTLNGIVFSSEKIRSGIFDDNYTYEDFEKEYKCLDEYDIEDYTALFKILS